MKIKTEDYVAREMDDMEPGDRLNRKGLTKGKPDTPSIQGFENYFLFF